MSPVGVAEAKGHSGSLKGWPLVSFTLDGQGMHPLEIVSCF